MARSQAARLNAEFGDVRIEVRGLTEALRALSATGDAATDMRDLMHSTGQIVADDARPRVPVVTGRLAASLRAGRGKTKAVVRGGTLARVPYAGVVHYGWPARGLAPNPFLVDAVQATRNRVVDHISQGLADLLRRHGLR